MTIPQSSVNGRWRLIVNTDVLHNGKSYIICIDMRGVSGAPGDRPIHGELGMAGQRVYRDGYSKTPRDERTSRRSKATC